MRALRVLPILFLLGCPSESVDGLIKEQRAGVEATFDAIRRIQLPQTTHEAPAVPLVLQTSAKDGVNAAFIYSEDLAKPGGAKDVPLRTMDSLTLVQCGSLLDTGKLSAGGPQMRLTQTPLTPTVARAYLTACARLRYALVIQGTAFKAPQVTSEQKFEPGFFRADVVAIDLTSGKSVGAFQIDAANKPDVSVIAGEDRGQRLLRDLEGSIYSALRDGLRTAFPGSVPPPAF